MTDWHEFRSSLETKLATVIAPELARAGATSVYVVLASEAGIEFDRSVLGATNPRASLWLKSAIGNRWKGAGPAMVLNTHGNAWLDSQKLGKRDAVTAASALHELVHNVMRICLFEADDQPDLDTLTFDRLMFAGDVRPAIGLSEFQSPDQPHGWRFCRLVCHAAERLRQLGQAVSGQALLSWPYYTGKTVWQWQAALAEEIEEYADLPLSAIAAFQRPDTI